MTRALPAALALVLAAPLALAEEAALAPEAARAAQAAALQALVEGNARFAAERPAPRDAGAARRHALTRGQHPRAAILSCSDSRLPPEIVLDQQLGEVFVVRTAGNVSDPLAIGSLEYAVDHLGVPLVVVMGHGSCGAVKAAIQVHEGKAHLHGNVAEVVRRILPAVERASRSHPDDLVDAVVRASVQGEAKALLAHSPLLARKVRDGQLRIVTAIYDLETGTVAFAQ